MKKWIELNSKVGNIVDGFYDVQKDKEATKSYFLDYVNRKTVFFHSLEEKLDFLVDGEYYDEEVLNQYKPSFVKNLFKRVYNHKFRFQSYTAANKFYSSYALKTDDGENILERYEDRVAMCALTLARGSEALAKDLADVMITQQFQPATPVFLNTGRKRSGRQVSCFILNTQDSTEGIMYSLEASAQLSRAGGGVGINISDIRASKDPIKGIHGAAGGPLGVAKMLEQAFSYFDQLGQRDGAGVAYMNVHHLDIEEFLSAKKINADETARLKTLSMGLLITDKLFQCAKENKPFYTFSPYSIEKKYGVKLSEIDMNEWYDKLVADPDITKSDKNPRALLTLIASVYQESGYPYLVFIDNANRQHALKSIGRIKSSNLCSEIFQIQTDSDLNIRGKESEYGADVSCVLGSLNIANVMKYKNIEKAVVTAVQALNAVVDLNQIEEVPSVLNGNDWYKAIGLGAMNLHGYLVSQGIKYSDPKAVEFSKVFFSTVRYWAIMGSVREAIKTNEEFKGFKDSEYYTGEVFNPYIKENHFDVSKDVQDLFKGIAVPTQVAWTSLKDSVKKYGMRNAYLMAVAPNGSTGYIQNATSGIVPVSNLVEERVYSDSKTYYLAPFLSKENQDIYESAFDIPAEKMIDVVAEIQKHVDQGISMTLFMDSDATTKDLVRVYVYAWHKGLKSIYYLRTKKISKAQECEACQV